jgi:hypothetical protein
MGHFAPTDSSAPLNRTTASPTVLSPQNGSPVIGLTGPDQFVTDEERVRKRRRVTIAVPKRSPEGSRPASPALSLAAISEQITQLQKGFASINGSASTNTNTNISPQSGLAALPSAADADDQSEDQERDEDGLVPVESCLKLAYEEMDGQVWCKMCK